MFRYYIGDIIVLHRVVEKYESCAQRNLSLEISISDLQALIKEYRNTGYTFVSLDDFYKEKRKFCSRKRLVTITMDDGYKDNFLKALPLFNSERIPFTVFVSVDIIEHTAALWWYVLEDILWHNKTITLDNHVYSLESNEEKNNAFNTIHAQLSKMDTTATINWFKKNDINWDAINNKYCRDLCLTWEELRLLAANPLCNIGSHTMTHARLPIQDRNDRLYELNKSKEILEQKLNRMIYHLSYPYGACSNEVIQDVQKAGYLLGLLSNGGSVRKDQSLFQLTRTKWQQ